MPYRYCENKDCQKELPEPTPREDLLTGCYCPNCGDQQPQSMTLEEWFISLYEALQAAQAI